MTTVAAATADGVFVVDLEDETVVGHEPDGTVEAADVRVELPLVIAASASGSTVVAVLRRRPPLAVSYDAGVTWQEAGGGLPEGRAVAVGDDPDLVVYAARNRLYVSTDGARFFRALPPELPEILALELR